jgi:hypothetical protein
MINVLIKLVTPLLLEAEVDVELGTPMLETAGDAVDNAVYVNKKLC